MFDIVIIGSGISGLVLASLLDKKYKILLLDKRSMNKKNFDSKSCGGMLNPKAQKALLSIGISLPKDILVNNQPFGLKILDLKNNITSVYQKSYINIDRKKFEEFLQSKLGSNVTHIEKACFKRFKEKKKNADIIEIEYLKDGKEYKEEAKFLVASDGAMSTIRNTLFKNKGPKEYVTIQEYYKWNKYEPYYYGIADSDITDFYSWLIPKEDYIILGSSFNKKKNGKYDANGRFDKLKIKLKKFDFNFTKENFIKKEGSVFLRPNSMKELHFIKNKIVLIGEAAGLISPSSSEGVSYAINSAMCLATCLNKSLEEKSLKEYEKKVKKMARKMILKKYLGYIMYNDFIRKIIIKSKFKSVKIYKENQNV